MGIADRGDAVDDPIEPQHADIALRAYSLSFLPNAASEEENWARARLELREERAVIAARASEIARSGRRGTDEENWLLAERELSPSLTERRRYRTRVAYLEGSRRARDVERARIGERASALAAAAPFRSEADNWATAERQIHAEHRLITERAPGSWIGSPRWLDAERQLIEEGVIPLHDEL